jgi:hypothetical protein
MEITAMKPNSKKRPVTGNAPSSNFVDSNFAAIATRANALALAEAEKMERALAAELQQVATTRRRRKIR